LQLLKSRQFFESAMLQASLVIVAIAINT
jgi:hypothetical protein